MSDDKLPVAVVGLGSFGRQMLDALRTSPMVRVVGVSDRDPTRAAEVGRECDLPHYSDNRSLLAETRPAAVFLEAPPRATAELVTACAKRGIHVWKDLPLARSLDEGVALVGAMDKAGLKLAVGTQRRFSRSYRRARELKSRLGQVFLARGHYLFNWGPELGWRGDKASAGGGALMELGYHPIDLLVWMLGLPDEVYGAAAVRKLEKLDPAEKAQPPHDTDDTAAAILRYGSGLMASVVTTRCSGPVSEELDLHGRGGSIVANAGSCTLRDPDGNVLDRVCEDQSPLAVFRREAESFVTAIMTDSTCYECSGRENLLNLAVIEAIYLSQRTSQPESPLQQLQTKGLTVSDCLSLCKPEALPGG